MLLKDERPQGSKAAFLSVVTLAELAPDLLESASHGCLVLQVLNFEIVVPALGLMADPRDLVSELVV